MSEVLKVQNTIGSYSPYGTPQHLTPINGGGGGNTNTNTGNTSEEEKTSIANILALLSPVITLVILILIIKFFGREFIGAVARYV